MDILWHLTKGSEAPRILSTLGNEPSCAALCYFLFTKQERAAFSFPSLLSVLEVQWALAILMVLVSLGHLVRLSLQWGHLDPIDQERFVEFCTTKISLQEPRLALVIPRVLWKPWTSTRYPGKCRISLILKVEGQMAEHPPITVLRVGMGYCFPASKFCSGSCSLLEPMLGIPPHSQLLKQLEFHPVNPTERGRKSLHRCPEQCWGHRSCDRQRLWHFTQQHPPCRGHPRSSWGSGQPPAEGEALIYSPVSPLVLALPYRPFLLWPRHGLALPLFQEVHPFLADHEGQGAPFLQACHVVPKWNPHDIKWKIHR